MLVDTEFPIKWVTYCIPFGVLVYIFETHSSYIKSPLLKLYIEFLSIFLNIVALPLNAQIIFCLKGAFFNVASFGLLILPPNASANTHSEMTPRGDSSAPSCMSAFRQSS